MLNKFLQIALNVTKTTYNKTFNSFQVHNIKFAINSSEITTKTLRTLETKSRQKLDLRGGDCARAQKLGSWESRFGSAHEPLTIQLPQFKGRQSAHAETGQ